MNNNKKMATFDGRKDKTYAELVPFGYLSMIKTTAPRNLIVEQGRPHSCIDLQEGEHALCREQESSLLALANGKTVEIIDQLHERVYRIRFENPIVILEPGYELEISELWVDESFLKKISKTNHELKQAALDHMRRAYKYLESVDKMEDEDIAYYLSESIQYLKIEMGSFDQELLGTKV